MQNFGYRKVLDIFKLEGREKTQQPHLFPAVFPTKFKTIAIFELWNVFLRVHFPETEGRQGALLTLKVHLIISGFQFERQVVKMLMRKFHFEPSKINYLSRLILK